MKIKNGILREGVDKRKHHYKFNKYELVSEAIMGKCVVATIF